MNTLYDYITHVKGVEYLLSLLFIAGYLLLAELLKPKPFKTVVEAGERDLAFMKQTGYRNVFKTVGKILAAPFVGLAYVISLPFVFGFTLATIVLKDIAGLVGRSVSFGWRPMEAYLAGRKKRREAKKDKEK